MRFAERSGSSAVAKAIMVKSGTRKKTNDLLFGSLTALNVSSQRAAMTRTGCRYQQSAIKTRCLSMARGGRQSLNLRHGSQIDKCEERRFRQKKTAAGPSGPGGGRDAGE